jgi:septin family protein
MHQKQFLREFNKELLSYLVNNTTDTLIFVFGDAYERSNAFINKIFSEEVTNSQSFNKLDLNPPTEKEVLSVLKTVLMSENINHLSDDKILDIRNQSNKDLRSAIMTL